MAEAFGLIIVGMLAALVLVVVFAIGAAVVMAFCGVPIALMFRAIDKKKV